MNEFLAENMAAELTRDEITAKLEGGYKKYNLNSNHRQYDENKKQELETAFLEHSKTYFQSDNKSVLGLDIYKYSEHPEEKQNFIPYILDLLLNETVNQLKAEEKTLFGSFKIEENFISTGDGGYVIFPKPFHALVFNFYFYSILHLFNTEHLFPELKMYIGEIFIRSVITYDKVYRYNKNSYGNAIITNARILSKDRLDRFLIDKNTFEYFNRVCNGIASIPLIDREKFQDRFGGNDTYFFKKGKTEENTSFRNIHVQKLNDTLAKELKLAIYNVEIQLNILLKSTTKNEDDSIRFICSIGNLNTNNLE
jgi:hypothetical protein